MTNSKRIVMTVVGFLLGLGAGLLAAVASGANLLIWCEAAGSTSGVLVLLLVGFVVGRRLLKVSAGGGEREDEESSEKDDEELSDNESNAPKDIKVGDRVFVRVPAGADSPNELPIGFGVVTYTEDRTEVILDNGSGGMFPNRFVRRADETEA